MSNLEIMDDPPFRCMVRAAGGAEVWTHTTEGYKFKQFGWRCTNTESVYKLNTLIGNWYEGRCDLEELKKPESLPSQYGHYFNTTCNSAYNTIPVKTVPKELKNLKGRHPHADPAHQPEVDSRDMKAVYNSWKTTQRGDYLDPCFRRRPVHVQFVNGSPVAVGIGNHDTEDGGMPPVESPGNMN